MSHQVRKKLIEVALPLEAINEESALRKRKAPAGYPTTLHKWWAQRPLAAARAIIFAQMVDDPSSWPDLFPTEKAQQKERDRLFRLIEELILWENTTNNEVIQKARDEIWRSWRRACAENVDHPRAKELFDRERLPGFHDPFAGGASLPLEAQRLGLTAFASDLNPVAVLINKALIEIPPRFAGRPPINSASQANKDLKSWQGANGLAEDVEYYGAWMADEAERRIGHLYPNILITPEMVRERPDLKPYLGKSLEVIAWLWARTVRSSNPAFRDVFVPLVSSFMLSTKPGREAYLEPVIENGTYRFIVKSGKPHDPNAALGTKLGRGANFRCVMSGTPMDQAHIRGEFVAKRASTKLMAIVAQGSKGRVYLSPSPEHEQLECEAPLEGVPDVAMNQDSKDLVSGRGYGFHYWRELFTSRQLTTLSTLVGLVDEVRTLAMHQARPTLGSDAQAYADAVALYMAFAISRVADYGSTAATWRPKDSAMRSSLPEKAIQMTWDFAEASPFGKSSSGISECVNVVAKALRTSTCSTEGHATQLDAASNGVAWRPSKVVISTDPPYYNNVSYADLSDFFYVWLRASLRQQYPDLLATVTVPKADELVATPYRHGSAENAERFFLEGMTQAMQRLAESAHPAFPVTIYYAYKQAETRDGVGTASTGWETFLDAVIRAGFSVTGTWPVRTEGDNRQRANESNALASSIVLVCRSREASAATATRREFLTALERELPNAVADLQRGNIAPVDLEQASIGPGMAIFTRYSKVIDADGKATVGS
jgi:putative DNA methylase